MDETKKLHFSMKPPTTVIPGHSPLTGNDLFLFNEGSHFQLHEKMGAHRMTVNGKPGTYFAVWAPNANQVGVMGSFNDWNPESHLLHPREQSGIWEGFIPEISKGTLYKYHIQSKLNGYHVEKADPFSFFNETPPNTSSIVWDLDYAWGDDGWMDGRGDHNSLQAPMSIYEVHLGSWMRVPEEGYRSLTYRELAPKLADYLEKMNFTHVEFLPIMDHPFFGSWGYQITGYFAPSGCFGTPQDLMYLIDVLHQRGFGVILDWVPSHFPTDAHGLAFFDGTHLFEHSDPRKGRHEEWGSLVFNYGRHEVQSFLISNALFWLGKYHVDGFRVDAVASMLYLDYARQDGAWIPNEHGGREHLEAISFLRRFNQAVYANFPDVQTIAEESTSWPQVSRPTYIGGLGFGLKWDMGWMHDTLQYMAEDPVHRKYHHEKLTFRMLYAWHENFVLPLSHDEVVHGKASLVGKMPGDDWQKLANVRLLLSCMFAQPAKKLLFMGGEIGQGGEWAHDGMVEWHLLQYAPHRGLQQLVADLNHLYRTEPALHEHDMNPKGFEWIDCHDTTSSVVSFLRKGSSALSRVLVVCNFTPVPRANYRVGVPREGTWNEILNSDATIYGGSGIGNFGQIKTESQPMHQQVCSLDLTLPPLAALFFRCTE